MKYALTFLAAVAEVHAFWRMECSVIQTSRVDPILSPGSVSGHVHMVSGASNFNTTSSYDSLRQSFCTSCEIQDDMSAYWTPLMYYQRKDGSFVPVPQGGTVVYYLGRGDDRANVVSFPPGFRMISGDSTARSYDNTTMTYSDQSHPARPVADRVSFACLGTNYTNHPETPGFKYMDCANGLRAQIQFQSCWDGVNLYKSDQSHVAYLSQIDNGICPPTHPKLLPHLFYEIYYFPNSIDTSDGGSFVFANGDLTGYGFHGDFMSGWNPDVLQAGITQCLNSDDGRVSSCPPLAASDDTYHTQNCPERSSLVNEQVTGVLSALPGCNTPNAGPGHVSGSCNKPLPSLNTVTNMDGQKRQIPVVGTTYSGMTYKGCYVDATNGRALSGSSYTNTNMTLESCAAYCSGHGYSLFGTEYAQECYCGNSISTSTASQSDCAMACAGNLTEYCGGSARLSVFQITPTTSTSSPTVAGATYVGCYSDSAGSRAIQPGSKTDTSMTIEMCQQLAVSKNYKFFGLEYAGECYTGNNITSSSIGPLNCNMACKGNSSEICGGSSALSVFQNNQYSQITNGPITVANATFRYQGCYAEGSSGRALGGTGSYSFTDSNMTIEKCATACYNKGLNWIGTEYTSECYCNNVGPANGATTAPSDGDCSMPCGGNAQEYCGGSNRVTIYHVQSSSRIKRFAGLSE